MEFTSKTVRCNQPGLTQAQALAGLYESYGDVRVASIDRQGPYWLATIQQKVAEFPPPKDDEESGGPSDSPDSDSGGVDTPPSDSAGDPETDGPPSDGPPSDGPPEEGKEKGGEHEMMHLLHEIAKALGISGAPDDSMMPGEEPGMDGMGGPPPGPPGGDMPADPGLGGPPMGGGAMPKKPTKLKPGEVLPNQTPIGAPAFASVQKAASYTVESDRCDPRVVTAAQAKQVLESSFDGYRVKQMRYNASTGTYQALISSH